MAGMFDDLVPAAQPASPAMNFDDLIPKHSAGSFLNTLGQTAMEPFQNLAEAGKGAIHSFMNTGVGGAQLLGQAANAAGVYPDDKYNQYKQNLDAIQQAEGQMYGPGKQGAGYNIAGNIAGGAAQMGALTGAGVGNTAGQIAGNLPMVGNALKNYLPAAIQGGIFGGVQPAATDQERQGNALMSGAFSAGGKAIGDLLSTRITDPTKIPAMETAKDFNIPVYRSQVSDSPITKAVASFEKDVPLSGAGTKIGEQVGAFNKAVLGTIGQEGNAVTPEALKSADEGIGNVYKEMTKKYNIPVTPDVENSLLDLRYNAANTIGDEAKEYALKSQVDNVINHVKDGEISGSEYQSMRSKIGRLLRGQNSSPELGKLQDVLDTSFQGNMPAEDALKLGLARSQYRNMLSLEKVVANNPNEAISPAKLQGAVKNVFGDYAYSGGSNLERLARLGHLLKDTFPNSGTATRTQLYDLAKQVAGPALGVGVGAGTGYHEGGAGGALAGALLGLGLNRFGVTPYLYSQMSTGAPSMLPQLLQATAPAVGMRGQQ